MFDARALIQAADISRISLCRSLPHVHTDDVHYIMPQNSASVDIPNGLTPNSDVAHIYLTFTVYGPRSSWWWPWSLLSSGILCWKGWEFKVNLQHYVTEISSSSSFCRAPGSYCPGCTAAMWLIVLPLMFQLSPLVVSPEILVAKGGTMWARNGTRILPSTS